MIVRPTLPETPNYTTPRGTTARSRPTASGDPPGGKPTINLAGFASAFASAELLKEFDWAATPALAAAVTKQRRVSMSSLLTSAARISCHGFLSFDGVTTSSII
jgi:hypothetical protein